MFEEIINMFKYPITSTIEKSEKSDTKYELIRGAILTAIGSLITILGVIIPIFKIKHREFSYKMDKLKNAELFSTFFKTWIILIVTIAVIALIMFIICKLLKNNKQYNKTLSITNTAYTFYVIGSAINLVISLIYVPLGWIVLMAAFSLATYTGIFALRDSLELEDSNNFVQFTVAVLTVAVVLSVIVFCFINDISLKDLSDLSSLSYLLY